MKNQEGDTTHQASLREYGITLLVTCCAALFLKMFVIDAYRIPSHSMEPTLRVGDYLFVNKLAYGFRAPRTIPFTSIRLPHFCIPLGRKLQRGDIVVFEFPSLSTDRTQESEFYIKRCVGLPGDTILISQGIVRVNNKVLPFFHPQRSSLWKSYSTLYPPHAGFTEQYYGPLVVPKKGDTLTLTADAFEQWRTIIESEGHTVAYVSDRGILIDGRATDNYVLEKEYVFVLGDNLENSHDSRYWGFLPVDHIIGEALLIYWSWNFESSATRLSDRWNSIRWERIGKIIR